MNLPLYRRTSETAFSLVEVVLALGICSFSLIALLGLFSRGLISNRDSEQRIQAADLASMLISVRAAAPTNVIPSLPNFAIPPSSLSKLYAPVFNNGASLTGYIGLDGQTTNAANATYLMSCQAGTNSATGTGLSQVYLMLSWPPQLSASSANASRYEINTYIPLQ